jgi:hypothetical protein
VATERAATGRTGATALGPRTIVAASSGRPPAPASRNRMRHHHPAEGHSHDAAATLCTSRPRGSDDGGGRSGPWGVNPPRRPPTHVGGEEGDTEGVGEAEDEPESEQSADPRWRSTDLVISYAHLKLARAAAPPPASETCSHGGAREGGAREEKSRGRGGWALPPPSSPPRGHPLASSGSSRG